jgi:hypothetical protein
MLELSEGIRLPENFVKLDNTKMKLMGEELRKKFMVKVGVMGSKNARASKDFETNATIGARHEFGSASDGIPKRSFLKMPLDEKLPEELDEIGDDVFLGLTENNIEEFYQKLGIKAEEIVQEAFNTGGFGKWTPLSEVTIRKKGHDKILIDTVQLRRSISSEVVRL